LGDSSAQHLTYHEDRLTDLHEDETEKEEFKYVMAAWDDQDYSVYFQRVLETYIRECRTYKPFTINSFVEWNQNISFKDRNAVLEVKEHEKLMSHLLDMKENYMDKINLLEFKPKKMIEIG
jgi:hypothetical protein